MTTRNPNMDIHNLLNPEVSVSPMSHQRQIPRPDHIPRSAPATSLPLKKEKDMPTYRKQRPKLPVNFPPYAADPTSRIHEIHKAHGLFPLGDISEYAAHIPYSSSKTQFQEKTGRTAVEVFMYEFRVPKDETRGTKRYVVYWDYVLGLVRMTNIYKACGLAKIIPRKALQMNPGLIEISHSLTGGNLEAQGYWVPFEAAKAIAAKFAYPIRYLLTPIFGHDFPATCVSPDDPQFRNYKIDPSIVQICTKDTQHWLANAPAVASSSQDSSSQDIRMSGVLNTFEEILELSPEPSITGTDSSFPSPKRKAFRTVRSSKRALKRRREDEVATTVSPSPEASASPLLLATGVSSATTMAGLNGYDRSPAISPRSTGDEFSVPAPPSYTGSATPLGFSPAVDASGPYYVRHAPTFNHPQWKPNNTLLTPHHAHYYSESAIPLLGREGEAALAMLNFAQTPVRGTNENTTPRLIRHTDVLSSSVNHDAEVLSATALIRMQSSEPNDEVVSPRPVKRVRPSSR